MKTALALLLAVATLAFPLAQPAMAGSSTDAALALGAFAVFNQLLAGQTIFQQGFGPRHVVRETVVVQEPPAVIYAPPPPPTVIYSPPPVVVYPNGYAYGAPTYDSGHYQHFRRHHDEDDDD
jgi:hypothetical protein